MATSSLDPRAVNLIISENIEKPMARRMLQKKINKRSKRGELTKNFLNTPGENQLEWAHRIFAANMMLGKHDWWGWETRSPWAWELSNLPWQMPRWDGSQKTILVLAEQGLGDEILFTTAAKELAKITNVTWEIDDRLLPIYQRSIPEIEWISRWGDYPRGSSIPKDAPKPKRDSFIPAGNVPKLFRTDAKSYPKAPFLIPNPERVAFWREKYAGKHGFLFKAGALSEKSVPPSEIGSRGDVNLQHDVKIPWAENPAWEDMDDYIALIAALDGVTAVPSAVVHICGAIGQNCDVVRPPKKVISAERNTLLKWYYPNKRHMDWYGDHVSLYQNLNEFKHARRLPKA